MRSYQRSFLTRRGDPMVRKVWIAGFVALTFLGHSSLVCGQEDLSQPAPVTKRPFLSGLRESLFGGAKAEPQAPARRPASTEAKPTPAPAVRPAAVTPRAPMPQEAKASVTAPGVSSFVARQTIVSPDRVMPDEQGPLPDGVSDMAPSLGSAAGPAAKPLHERMSAFRKSSFGNDEQIAEAPVITAPSDKPIEPTVRADAKPFASDASPRSRVSASNAAVATKPAASKGAASDNVLIARKGPILSVETLGPRRITVGKESSYQLTASNLGEVPAEDVVVFVNLPAWAEVIGSESLVGTVQPGISGDEKRPLLWKLGQLGAGTRERLTLRIVPRESRPFDLGVRWDCRPVASQTLIEVQEPKLAMSLEGPREVSYGKREVFTLHLTNSGTGDAENVAIALMPINAGESQPATHRIGTIPAGEERAIEIELTARQTGELSVQVEARADGDIHTELAEKIVIRRASVNVEIVGPSVQFVNSMATYRIRVTNPGNTAARNVRLTAVLPPGAKYVSGIDNAKVEGGAAKVHWTTEAIRAGGEQTFTLKCSMAAAGQSRMEVVALADDDINATASTVTRVDAIADIAMEVRDPSGPVAVGDEAGYELRVFNRGTKAAENVEVLVFFSSGFEPLAVEGGQHRIQPGQIAFNPIPTIAPGAEVVLKVRAKADVAGAHIFRAEAHCKALGTRLVREETTHFYLNNLTGASAPQTAQGAKPSPAAEQQRDRVESASGTNLPKYGPLQR